MKRIKRIGILGLMASLLLIGLCWAFYRAVRQERLNRHLIAAIKQNRLNHTRASEVLACLRNGADPNARDEPFRSDLSWDHLRILMGIRKTPIIPAQSALLLALEGDFKNTIFSMNGNGNVVDQGQLIFWGDPDIVKLLLQYGADIRVKDKHGRTAFAAAFSPVPLDAPGFSHVWIGSNSKCEQLLLAAGANVEDRDENGHTALMEQQWDQVREALLHRGANINAVTRDGMTALIYHAEDGDERGCRFLLEHGADANHADASGNTALLHAISTGMDDLVNTLLKHGAEVNVRGENGQTPLMLAASGGHNRIVGMLLQYGATVDTKDTNGWTALTDALANDEETCVRMLLDRGANVKIKDREGATLSQIIKSRERMGVFKPANTRRMLYILKEHGMRE